MCVFCFVLFFDTESSGLCGVCGLSLLWKRVLECFLKTYIFSHRECVMAGDLSQD